VKNSNTAPERVIAEKIQKVPAVPSPGLLIIGLTARDSANDTPLKDANTNPMDASYNTSAQYMNIDDAIVD